jgi:hypothetical protein
MGDENDEYSPPPPMPPFPSALNVNNPAASGCPPCAPCVGGVGAVPGANGMMMMYPPYANQMKSRSKSKRGGGNATFFIMLVSAGFFATGVWFSVRLPSYAPGGSREDAKTFTFVQILSTSLISAGVLLLVIAWFTGK